MAVQPQSPARLAFGLFEVDSAAGELRKNGIRVPLSGQPFRILLVSPTMPESRALQRYRSMASWWLTLPIAAWMASGISISSKLPGASQSA